MKTQTRATKPPQGMSRPTTLSLTPEIWGKLKQIEKETGAKPSVIVRRMIEHSCKCGCPNQS